MVGLSNLWAGNAREEEAYCGSAVVAAAAVVSAIAHVHSLGQAQSDERSLASLEMLVQCPVPCSPCHHHGSHQKLAYAVVFAGLAQAW